MLSFDEILSFINDKKFDKRYEKDFRILESRRVYFGMSLHIDGICPTYRYLDGGGVYQQSPKWLGWCMEYDFIFNAHLFSRHPRENEEQRQWRLSQYKPFTRAPFLQCISVITGAIFQDSSYSITVENKDDNDYIWGNNFYEKNLVQCISDNFQHIAEDPNGLFVVIPKEPGYDTTTSKIEPEIWFVHSKFLRWQTRDEVIFEREGYVWVINRVGYFRFQRESEKSGKYIHVDEKYGGYYAHVSDRVPAFTAGGIWNSQGYYDSWFVNAKPLADEYVSTFSSLQMVNKEASHPFIIETDTDCPDCAGKQQVQWCFTCSCSIMSGNCKCNGADDSWKLRDCPTCHGKGTISHNPGDRIIAPSEDMKNQLVQIVNPSVDVNKFHAEFTEGLYNQIFRSLYLNYIEQAQSGVAKDKDMEARYQFILRISNDLFDRLIPNILKQIFSLRNSRTESNVTKPYDGDFTITKPTQFQIKTSFDLLNEYKEATASQIPDYQREALLEDFVDKQFGGDDVLVKKTQIINRIDILAVMPTADIQVALLNQAATSRDYQFHLHLPKILDVLANEKGKDWFVKSEIDVIEGFVKTAFDRIKPPPKVITPTQSFEETRVNI